MESMVLIRPLTFRVENIPPDTTAEGLTKYFYTEDQPHIRVRSIVPSVDSYELDIREYTATVTFQASNQRVLSPRLLDEDISIDCDFHGFTPLYHPQEPIAADIIAVTGLAAHAFGSWAHSTQNMWLRDYLPRDVSNARVLIYGYPSQLHGNISRSILSDYSTNMIHRLLTMRESAKCQDRPIVFIGHSLGCLIIKKVLCDINGSVGIYSSRLPVRSIIFLGAPHKGLETTALETLVKSQATEDMIRELKAESPTLTELNDKFRHVAKNIDILTCYELSPTKTAIEMPDGTWRREGPPIMMVPLDSARQWYPREVLVACNADHSQIAKLKRGENSIYPSVRWAIKKALLSAGDLYSEAKGIHHDESSRLGNVEEASATRRSLLQASHGQTSKSSNDGPTYLAPVPSSSLFEEATDQPIEKLRHMRPGQSARGSDTQSKNNPDSETVSQWQSGIDISERDRTLSFSSLTDTAEIDMTSTVLDESSSASMSTNPPTSLDAETSASKGPKEEAIPALPKMDHQIDGTTTLGTKDPGITIDGAKSMIMEDVLSFTIVNGSEEKIEELLAHSYDVNCKDLNGFTPLLLAARFRKENVLRLLLKKGANPGAKDYEGRTTLHWLSSFPGSPISETLIDLLLNNRSPLEVPNDKGTTLLMTACRNGEQLLAMKLIRHGANLRAIDQDGWTPLHYAAAGGDNGAPIIPQLIASGAELEAKSRNEETPLHIAAEVQHDSSDTIEQLLLAGADKEAMSENSGFRYWRLTPLLVAVKCRNKACVARLLDHGANIEAKGVYERRPLHYAAMVDGQPEVLKMLLDHGGNIEATNVFGRRPLHLAAEYGQLEKVKMLLDHGANPTVRNTFLGKKPSTISMKDNVSSTQKEAIRTLLKEAEKTWKKSGK